jgi:hypothetical protein
MANGDFGSLERRSHHSGNQLKMTKYKIGIAPF